MVTTGDILRITILGNYEGNIPLQNVFDYRVNAVPANTDIGDIAGGWLVAFAPVFEPLVSSLVSMTQIKIENLTNNIDLAEFSASLDGTVTGDALPAFNAYGFKLTRSSKVTRSGSKRFAGIPELYARDGRYTGNSTQLNAMEQFLGNLLVLSDIDGLGNDASLVPVIIGRTKNVDGVYELDLSKINNVKDATINTQITSQNSRKI